MIYRISLSMEPAFRARVDPGRLRAAARATLRHQHAASPGALSLLVTGDAALRRLNRQFLGHNTSTDVLSFPSEDLDPETGARYFGDIAISYPRARLQAAQGRHPIWAELQLLVVHGTLHLLGHDHAAPEEKARMWAAQAEILAHLKAPLTADSYE
jgi:probable rRNA maturation factor